jgi:nicotinate-nucleotide adenylyltransferase
MQPLFSIDTLELEREGPSFTIDTVDAFRSRFARAQIFLLLGEDNLPKLHSWHQFERLRQLVSFVSFGRRAHALEAAAPAVAPDKDLRLERLVRKIDISSTEIRARVAKGLPIQYLVPESVRLLIQSHALYIQPV